MTGRDTVLKRSEGGRKGREEIGKKRIVCTKPYSQKSAFFNLNILHLTKECEHAGNQIC